MTSSPVNNPAVQPVNNRRTPCEQPPPGKIHTRHQTLCALSLAPSRIAWSTPGDRARVAPASGFITKSGTRDAMQTQTRIRFQLPEGGLRPIDRKLAERQLNQESLPPMAKGFHLTRTLREACKNAMRQIHDCPPALLGAAVENARTVSDIAQAALSSSILDPIEEERTERQMAHPSTLADWVAALDQTVRAHRAPIWFNPQADALARLEHKLDLIAGHLATKGGGL